MAAKPACGTYNEANRPAELARHRPACFTAILCMEKDPSCLHAKRARSDCGGDDRYFLVKHHEDARTVAANKAWAHLEYGYGKNRIYSDPDAQ